MKLIIFTLFVGLILFARSSQAMIVERPPSRATSVRPRQRRFQEFSDHSVQVCYTDQRNGRYFRIESHGQFSTIDRWDVSDAANPKHLDTTRFHTLLNSIVDPKSKLWPAGLKFAGEMRDRGVWTTEARPVAAYREATEQGETWRFEVAENAASAPTMLVLRTKDCTIEVPARPAEPTPNVPTMVCGVVEGRRVEVGLNEHSSTVTLRNSFDTQSHFETTSVLLTELHRPVPPGALWHEGLSLFARLFARNGASSNAVPTEAYWDATADGDEWRFVTTANGMNQVHSLSSREC